MNARALYTDIRSNIAEAEAVVAGSANAALGSVHDLDSLLTHPTILCHSLTYY
jgi:hypothetical protein